MRRYRWNRKRPVRHETDVSRALGAAHRESRYTFKDLGAAFGANPRTVRRWELGESTPRAEHWPRVLAFYARFAPGTIGALCASIGRAPPDSRPAVDAAAARRLVSMTADTLDIAPKRVREVLRAALRAAGHAGITLEALTEVVLDDDPGPAPM